MYVCIHVGESKDIESTSTSTAMKEGKAQKPRGAFALENASSFGRGGENDNRTKPIYKDAQENKNKQQKPKLTRIILACETAKKKCVGKGWVKLQGEVFLKAEKQKKLKGNQILSKSRRYTFVQIKDL